MIKLIVLSLTLILIGCQPKTIHVDHFVKPKINLATQPLGIKLSPVHFYVISEVKDKGFYNFKKEFKKRNQNIVFTAMSIQDYENLANNVQELRRYMTQQGDIIIYYENMLNEFNKEVHKE